MSKFFKLLLIFTLISKKILSSIIEECSDLIDCFNCTLTPGCIWENQTCLNYTDVEYNSTLLDTDNSTILYHDLKYIRNICFDTKAPYIPEENYIYNDLSNNYCGDNLFFVNDWNRLNGIRIELNNNNGIYGTPNLLCEYVLTHGSSKIDVDIYINRTLSKDFLLFYSDDFDENIHINYSTTLILHQLNIHSSSFLYYSNKSFETSPFIIYFKREEPPPESEVLTYLFLAATIGFILLAIGGIIFVRNCSLYFKLKYNKKKKNEIVENVGNLSVISEKNMEENSKNDMEIDPQELKTIKGNNEDNNTEIKNEDKKG